MNNKTQFILAVPIILSLLLTSIIIIDNQVSIPVEEPVIEMVEDEKTDISDDLELKEVDPKNVPSEIKTSTHFPENIRSKEQYFNPPVFLGNEPKSARPLIIEDRPMTRGSDEEKDMGWLDVGNGSVLIRPSDTVEGSLTYHPDGYDNDTFDFSDNYKFSVKDVDPSPFAPNGTIIADFTLNSYTGTATMYEKGYNETNEMIGDFWDVIWVSVAYRDYFGFDHYLIGHEFFYDDGDDSDGWSHKENWTFRFETPIPTYTEEDKDGGTNGYTEIGWYYIWIFQGFYYNGTNVNESDRGPLSINYSFTFNTDIRNDTDEAGNDWFNATDQIPAGEKVLDSRSEQIDWYVLKGEDPSKLWSIDFRVNRTSGLRLNSNGGVYCDTWIHLYVAFYHWGYDTFWNTPDDFWYCFDGGVISMYLIGPSETGGYYSQAIRRIMEFPEDFNLDNPHKEIYVGIYLEPRTYYFINENNLIFQPPFFRTTANYTLEYEIDEIEPNNPPVISNIMVTSDYDQSPIGGNLDSEFDISVIYTDKDNDPPKDIVMIIDPNSNDQKGCNLRDHEVDDKDSDYTDGKEYMIRLKGSEIGASSTPHSIKIYATDLILTDSLRDSKISKIVFKNDSLIVWDDYPLSINYENIWSDPLFEDGPPVVFYLNQNDGGPFLDPENEIRNIRIKNATTGEWGDSFDDDLLHIDVGIQGSGSWFLTIRSKPDQNGQANITLMAEDDHSSISLTITIKVKAVNDPPAVRALKYDQIELPVGIRSGRFLIDLGEDVTVLEDNDYKFNIIADDPDGDRSDLTYELVSSQSDDWHGSLSVEPDTGEISLLAVNDDVLAGNGKIIISVDDGKENGKVYFEIKLDITNVNDGPEIFLPSDISLLYDQFDRISIKPVFSDMDPDDHLTLDVNMVHDIIEYKSISDMIPEARLVEGSDWTFSSVTGQLVFHLDDQNIWKQGVRMKDQVTILLAFMVSDLHGGYAITTIELTLKDVNEPPPTPGMFEYTILDEDPTEPGLQGLTVTFKASEVVDPDLDELTYTWVFGDGQKGTGIQVEHTYSVNGTKTITLVVSDREFSSEPRRSVINLVGPTEPPQTSPDASPEQNNEFLFIILIFVIIVLMIGMIFLFILLMRKPPIKEEQEEE